MGEFLRLRHRLMPYLYTMNYRASESAEPMIMPMYYKHPEAAEMCIRDRNQGEIVWMALRSARCRSHRAPYHWEQPAMKCVRF